MINAVKEKSPVIYNAAAIKTLSFSHKSGKDCFAMHWHERLEILYIKKGIIEYTLANKKGVAKEGMAVIIGPKTAHYAKSKTDVEYDVLMFDLRYFYNETDICKNLLTTIFEGGASFENTTSNTKVTDCIQKLCQSEDISLMTVSLVYSLLHLLVTENIITLTQRRFDKSVDKVTKYIEENFAKDLSTSYLCSVFGYSEGHFCRKFKESTGLTPMSYLKIYRLERAYKMICAGEGKISEIARICGFDDSNYFTRMFTAHYKHPPTYFKKIQ